MDQLTLLSAAWQCPADRFSISLAGTANIFSATEHDEVFQMVICVADKSVENHLAIQCRDVRFRVREPS